MSQHTYTCIEQLDLAAEQLSKDSPSYSRFALILVDNVVELILHNACRELLSWDNMWIKLGKPKYSARQREEATGQWFGGKVKFLKQARKLTAEEMGLINICHKYRNELYHAGLCYDDIVFDIAWHYHDCAVKLLGNINPNNSWHSLARVTPVVAKHAGPDGASVIWDMQSVIKSLKRCRPNCRRKLTKALSDAAIKRVSGLAEEIAFLVKYDPNRRSEQEILIEAQIYEYLRSNIELMKDVKSQAQLIKKVEDLKITWKPRFTKNPLPKYRGQALKILLAKSDTIALEQFERFRDDIADFADFIDRTSASLDGYLTNQEEIARGK